MEEQINEVAYCMRTGCYNRAMNKKNGEAYDYCSVSCAAEGRGGMRGKALVCRGCGDVIYSSKYDSCDECRSKEEVMTGGEWWALNQDQNNAPPVDWDGLERIEQEKIRAMREPVICAYRGCNEITPIGSRGKRLKYCSNACGSKASRERKTGRDLSIQKDTCMMCGESMPVSKSPACKFCINKLKHYTDEAREEYLDSLKEMKKRW